MDRTTLAGRNAYTSPNGDGPIHTTNGTNGSRTAHAEVYPLRDASDVACDTEIELVIFRFTSFGRLAHFRRSLLALPYVRGARIASYGDQTALFALTVSPGTAAGALVVPGTRLIGSNGSRIELCVEA